jgi:PAS domain-containing protein
MATFDLEIILSRQLAECLNTAMFIVDLKGNLVYYNEPAETILGRRFEDTGPMPVDVWATVFIPKSEDGRILQPQELPLVKTLETLAPAHGVFYITNRWDETHKLTVTSFPLTGLGNRNLGAVALFWET